MQHEVVQLTPFDEHNQQLESNVHPPDWPNPTADKPYHLVVILSLIHISEPTRPY